jgi:hypothetical protein
MVVLQKRKTFISYAREATTPGFANPVSMYHLGGILGGPEHSRAVWQSVEYADRKGRFLPEHRDCEVNKLCQGHSSRRSYPI